MSESYRVSVRTLCEFAAKSGDLDLRFTPSPTGQQGIEGHRIVTARRPERYQRELALSGECGPLRVAGRADGYDPAVPRLEEIKTYRGDPALIPDNHRALHWAQLKVYGALACREWSLEGVELALVYFDIVRQTETADKQWFEISELDAFFKVLCDSFSAWARQELAHRRARDRAAEKLSFPHPAFRDGQRPLAESVYRAAATGSAILAEAPTGIGKTMGTLFPLLKAMPGQGLDRIFYLTAKTPGRRLALDAAEQLEMPQLRTLELVAREKSCEHPDKSCHGESCPLARGFYDRLPEARAEAAAESRLTQARLRELALKHDICPYYLGQEMARWADLVVGDYNHYFDQSAMLHGLTAQQGWRSALLVDEAHNLVERARDMYSAALDQLRFRQVKRQAPAALKGPMERLNRAWNALNRAQPEEQSFVVQSGPPERWLQRLQRLSGAITDYLTEHPFALDSQLMQLHFDALNFLKVAELYDPEHFLCDLEWRRPPRGRPGTVLSLRNLVPAPHLRPRFELAQSATLFSGTLKPADYYRDLLGLPADCPAINVPSPFSAEQLQVHIARDISTRYRDREGSLLPIVELMASQYRQRPGNYLAFFSSYRYLEQVLALFQSEHPSVPVWAQSRSMSEGDRHEFLQRFESRGQGIGFAVLGGAFAEGVDLPGDRLIGAFIATLGLPQINEVNDILKDRLARQFGPGYEYAYLYPGLRKVVQAAGRVIRSEQDSGVIHLMDERFLQSKITALLPAWWSIGCVNQQ